MPSFSSRSKAQLSTCHPRLIDLFNEVVEHFDCTIIEGYRGTDRQNELMELGKSQLPWPDSKHNKAPSLAVDVAPYPVDWEDRDRFNYFAGWVKAIAAIRGIGLRWGGDWDDDTQVRDNRFDDLVHFELET